MHTKTRVYAFKPRANVNLLPADGSLLAFATSADHDQIEKLISLYSN